MIARALKTAMPPTPTKTRLHLLCPGLFAPAALLAGQGLRTPALDRLLARAEPRQGEPRDPLATLAAAFGLRAPPDQDLPLAPLALLAEAPELARDGCWFHADPVHLRPDRDRLLLFSGPGLRPEPDESAALIAAFNDHFAREGLHLTEPRPGAWYLRVDTAPGALRTQPLPAVAGRPLDAFLPTGADARAWTRWQNEAQMLFHQHPVNRAREQAGRPGLNGVWTWGGGVLPRIADGPGLSVADHPLARGLARAAGGPCRPLAELPGLLSPAAVTAAGADRGPGPRGAEVLVFWDALWWPALTGDSAAWGAALADLETLAAGLWEALAAGSVATLTLDDGAGSTFFLDRFARLRVWRRRGGLCGRLGGDPGGLP